VTRRFRLLGQFILEVFLHARIGQGFIHRIRKPLSLFHKTRIPALLILFVRSIESFEVPALLGLPPFPGCSRLAGLAGCLSAHGSSFIGPNEYGFETAVTVLSFALLGGIGTPLGPVFAFAVFALAACSGGGSTVPTRALRGLDRIVDGRRHQLVGKFKGRAAAFLNESSVNERLDCVSALGFGPTCRTACDI